MIQRQGADRVVVQLPGVQDTAQAKRILGATATLEYRGVVEGNAYDAVASGNVPPEARVYYMQGDRAGRQADPDPAQQARDRHRRPAGRRALGLRLAAAVRRWCRCALNGIGGQRMFDYTSRERRQADGGGLHRAHPRGDQGVDGKEVRSTRISEQVINAATIQGVFGKQFQTTGLDSSQEAADLALLLRAGALAAPMDFVEERIVGPSLGAENIERGLTAVMLLVRVRAGVLPGLLPHVRRRSPASRC